METEIGTDIIFTVLPFDPSYLDLRVKIRGKDVFSLLSVSSRCHGKRYICPVGDR